MTTVIIMKTFLKVVYSLSMLFVFCISTAQRMIIMPSIRNKIVFTNKKLFGLNGKNTLQAQETLHVYITFSIVIKTEF